MKRALVTGITGQDGSYLADVLTERGYEVFGLYRHRSSNPFSRIAHLLDKVVLIQGDVCDSIALRRAIDIEPDEIYHMADQDSVTWSYDNAGYQIDVTIGAVARLLELVRVMAKDAKVFIPSSATIFSCFPPQDEDSAITPLSPYACAKAAVRHICSYHRAVNDLRIICGIMFNHDSPRRNSGYLLQKIARSALDVVYGRRDKVRLGQLDYKVDIGHAQDYMEAVVNLMSLRDSGDYVFATGRPYTIRTLVMKALEQATLIADRPSPSTDYKNLVIDTGEVVRKGPMVELIGYAGKLHRVLENNGLPVQFRDALDVLRLLVSCEEALG